MAKKIIWSPRSISNLESVFEYISRDSHVYASHFVDRIISVIEKIPDFPESGRVVPEYNDSDIREKIFGNYRIVYRLREEIIEIAAIVNAAQLLTKIE